MYLRTLGTIFPDLQKAIDDAMTDCLNLLQRVDAVVQNTLVDNNPQLIAEWNIRRRVVGRTPTRSAPPEPACTPAA